MWLALDEVTAEHGPMEFFNGSDREGPLGIAMSMDNDLLHQNPWLRERYELSDPVTYHPGDATIHNGLVVHGSKPNVASTIRWSFLSTYFPSDTLYKGAPWSVIPKGVELPPKQPFDPKYFPVLYP